jgi:hypothetical protein
MRIRNAMIVALASIALSLVFIAPASAAWFIIDDSNPLTVTISAGDFEGGFYVEGQPLPLTIGFGNRGSITLPDIGEGYSISGSWITQGESGSKEILFALAGNPTVVTSGLTAYWVGEEGKGSPFSSFNGESGFGCYNGPAGYPEVTPNSIVFQDGHTESYETPYLSITFISENPVPIPSALLLFAPGLAGLAAIRRRFTK